jgi:hypothetical protein
MGGAAAAPDLVDPPENGSRLGERDVLERR